MKHLILLALVCFSFAFAGPINPCCEKLNSEKSGALRERCMKGTNKDCAQWLTYKKHFVSKSAFHKGVPKNVFEKELPSDALDILKEASKQAKAMGDNEKKLAESIDKAVAQNIETYSATDKIVTSLADVERMVFNYGGKVINVGIAQTLEAKVETSILEDAFSGSMSKEIENAK